MNRVGNIVGLSRNGQNAHMQDDQSSDELLLEGYRDDGFADDAPPLNLDDRFVAYSPKNAFVFRSIQALLLLSAALWLGLAGAILVRRNFVLPPLEDIPSAAATFCLPLVMLGVLWLILVRGSLGQATRFSIITAQLNRESEALDRRLATVNQQLDTARKTMQEQASLLEHYGASASINLETTAAMLGEHATSSARHIETIAQSGMAIRQQVGQLTDSIPMLENRAMGIGTVLSESGDALAERIVRLEAKLESLVNLTEEARSRSLAATQSLTAQLLHVQDATRSASEELTGMADLSANRVGTAIERARQAVDETALTLDMRMSDLNILVDQSRTALDSIGGEAINSFRDTVDMIETRMQNLDRMIDGQTRLLAWFDNDLNERISLVDQRFSALETSGVERNERMASALDAIARQAAGLDEALQAGNKTAEMLIGRSESLLIALDASVREIDETHPAALARLNETIGESRRLLASATPEIENLEAVADALLGRARETTELLQGQGSRLTKWLENSENALSANHDQVRSLEAMLRSADESARRLTDSSGPQLVAALMRIKDTAEQAAERAHQALGRAISDAAGTLGEASEAALEQVLGEKMTGRIAEMSTVAERAVHAAHTASDRLMRQLITIADTTANIEGRIKEAEEASEARDRDHFARRSALLIESLNSASIDIAKSLSTEIGDSNWSAYLKGDRGVFTRRAVRLLDAGEARSIAALYDESGDFREQVNRYIHDFEAMLRTILSARDGSALAVTLLSSDIGKLYVAMAQAIDRLRN